MAKDTIGIDVSKDRLNAFWHSRTDDRCLTKMPEGSVQLYDWLDSEKDVLIDFEATGAYHQGLERYLSLVGLVNPKQARRFAQAIGRLAKADSVDARTLACIGVVLELIPQDIEHEDIYNLRELLTARRALIKNQVTAKTQLATALNPLAREQLGRGLEDISADIQALDEAIAQIIRQRGTLEERTRRLVSIPGIGRLTATTMLIDMPEPRYPEGKKITALDGLAPMTQKAGKAKKLAITAIMRGIIILANTLLRKGRDWKI